jgi:hypothetical protein
MRETLLAFAASFMVESPSRSTDSTGIGHAADNCSPIQGRSPPVRLYYDTQLAPVVRIASSRRYHGMHGLPLGVTSS